MFLYPSPSQSPAPPNSPSPLLFKMELTDDEDLLSPPPRPLSPLAISANLSQLSLGARPLMDTAVSFVNGLKKTFHLRERPTDKLQVWKVNEFISRNLVYATMNTLKEQAEELVASDTGSSTSDYPASTSTSQSTFSSPLTSEDLQAANNLVGMRNGYPLRPFSTTSLTSVTSTFAPTVDTCSSKEHPLCLEDLPAPDGDWHYNKPGARDFVPFPIIHPSGHVLDATYVKYDLVPNSPEILGSHGKGQPTHSQPLRPKRADRLVDRYTDRQARLFNIAEPVSKWIEQALLIEGDVTLTAGVHHYQYLKRTADLLSIQTKNLMYQLSTTSSAAAEALRDLQNADAFRRLTEQIDWMDRPYFDDPLSQEEQSYRDIISSEVPPPSYKPPIHLLHPRIDTASPKSLEDAHKHANVRCHRCRERGHVVRNCPQVRTRPPKPYARPVLAIRQGKKKVVGYKVY